MQQTPVNLVLASSSRYRQGLLAKLGIQCQTIATNIDESRERNERPQNMAQRLARNKALEASKILGETKATEGYLIIGSDQVAAIDSDILGKPGNHDKACEQLRRCSGRSIHFHTALCLYNSLTQQFQEALETYEVKFRPLSPQQINYYIEQEKPYDCAGSFKSEGLGISLFEYIRGDDPNSLIGLPLIKLTEMLLNEGLDILAPHGE